jgi:serine/threonine-protein kinase
MGEVWRAHDPRLHRDVAIKIAAAEFSERSAREARLAAALNHLNICHIYDVGPNYLVMELIEGPTLAERLRQGPIPQAEAFDIARQVAEALEAAHEKGIVHRDLKPGNIKLRPDGTVKVLDFGLAKSAEEVSRSGSDEDSPTITLEQATRTGTVLGTAAYMAPEQARGKHVDKRADIWAYGVVLYEMLSGRRLFSGETISDTLAAVLTREPDWTQIPRRAEPLLRRCLQRDPRQRLRDIGEARFLLEAFPAAPAAAARSTLPWKIAAALALVAIVAAVLLWRLTHRAPPAVLRLSVDLGEDAAISPYRGASMALSPDGSELVFTVGMPLDKQHLALRRLDQPKAVPLANTDGVEAPFFSPDGKSIGFFADGKLKRMELGGGAPVTICDAPRSRGGSWGDDGNIIFAPINTGGGLFRVPAGGGVPHPVTRLDPGEDSHRYPQVLPGAEAVLFMSGDSGEGTVVVQNLKTGRRRTLVTSGANPGFLPGGRLIYYHRGVFYVAPMDAVRLELTGPAVPVLDDPAFQPGTGSASYTFSRSGMFSYVASDPQLQLRPIVLMDEKGDQQPLPVLKAKYRHPRVSPDGARLVVTMDEPEASHLWIYEWSSRRFSRLPSPAGNSERPLWMPDSQYLLFYSDAQTPGPGIYYMRSDGVGSPQRLVEGTDMTPRSVTPHVRQLTYDVTRGPQFGSWMVPLDSTDPAHLKPGAPKRISDHDTLTFSPDGRWLAYISGESGLPEAYVQPFPVPGGPWQASSGNGGGDRPVWSRAAPLLFYQSPNTRQIMVLGYTASGEVFTPVQPRLWAAIPVEEYDLMPDGKRVVMIPAVDHMQATHATFLLNFIDTLPR